MWLFPKDDRVGPEQLAELVAGRVYTSRFRADVRVERLGRKLGVKVSNVRLRRRKDYCGAHPGPCLRDTGRRHPVAAYLEGLDWVGFNALLNDLLDDLGLHCDVWSYNRERVESGRYFVRHGRRRRVRYPYAFGPGGNAHWTQSATDFVPDGVTDRCCFEDHCGGPHPGHEAAILDSGTPGYPCYTPAEEEEYRDAE